MCLNNRAIKVKELKQGDLFQLNDNDNAPLWIRGEYVRSEKKFSCTKYEDVNHETFFKGEKVVYADKD